ncbi:MAG TPA: ABC transporter permease [Candidatus Acidoferrales bacterium]|nr:ABC transporter permease [Candidatus Acidoferrales bacterium]
MSEKPQVNETSRTSVVAFGETLRLALDTLRVHKLRTFLTLLGVILSVFTLVLVMSVVEGLNRYISDKVANLGANTVIFTRFGIITNFQDFIKAQKRPPLRIDDYEWVRDHTQQSRQVGASANRQLDVRYGNETVTGADVFGGTPNMLDLRGLTMAQGRAFNDTDEDHRSPVCIIGDDLVQRFFPGVDPVGKTVRVGPQTYQVVGTAKPLGAVFGNSRDNFVWMPFSTYMKTWHLPDDSVDIWTQAWTPESMDSAIDEVRVVLRSKRKVPYATEDNFGTVTNSSITQTWTQLTGSVFGLAIMLTSVFLVVGGIVIMNIMLASVTERTREIGIRKSLGARRRHIVMQFLVESAMMAASGGVMGVLAGMGVTALVRNLTFMPATTPVAAIIVSLTLATSVGLFFGIYPAMRAARLDPVEALRHEV